MLYMYKGDKLDMVMSGGESEARHWRSQYDWIVLAQKGSKQKVFRGLKPEPSNAHVRGEPYRTNTRWPDRRFNSRDDFF